MWLLIIWLSGMGNLPVPVATFELEKDCYTAGKHWSVHDSKKHKFHCMWVENGEVLRRD